MTPASYKVATVSNGIVGAVEMGNGVILNLYYLAITSISVVVLRKTLFSSSFFYNYVSQISDILLKSFNKINNSVISNSGSVR